MSRIVPRKMDFDFDARVIPRWWFLENPFVTHFSNGLHLVFPEGERFFIRSVKHYMHQIAGDPELLERARGFFAQEARHGHEHAESFAMLEAQGYDVKRFLHFYEKTALPRLEKLFSPAMRLSVTVALEHLTATMGESALSEDFLDAAHPLMQALLRWHAAEEIEHKSVAFDVFEKVDGRHSVRVAGMVIGLAGLLVFWNLGARMLMSQERGLSKDELLRYRKEALGWRRGHTRRLLTRAFFDYVKPGFHPDHHDNYDLARDYLDSIGRLAA